MESINITLKIMGELYAGSCLELAANNALFNISNIITYIATVLVTLTAIALPLTQQSLQWMEDKYDSENVVKYLNEKAPIQANSIVPRVLIYLLLSLIFFLAHELLPIPLKAFFFITIITYFAYVVVMYSRYFAYVFKNLSSSTYIYDKILEKTESLDEITVTEIAVLMDIEKIRLIKKHEVNELSGQATKLGYLLKSSDMPESIESMNTYLNSLHKILYSLPKTAPEEKYTKTANFLSYLTFQLLGDSKHNISLSRLNEIIVWVESKRDDTYKPLTSGRFLIEFVHFKNRVNICIPDLIKHLRTLIWHSKKENIQIITELYKNICKSLWQREKNGSYFYFFFHFKIGEHLYKTNLHKELEELFKNNESKVTKSQITLALKNAGVQDDKKVDEFMLEVWDNAYIKAAEQLAYTFLLYFHNKESHLLTIRNINNPIKTNFNNLTSELLPSSIDEIFSHITNSEKLDYFVFEDSPRENIIHSSGMLLIYEVIKCIYNNKKPLFSSKQFQYQDLSILIYSAKRLKIIVKNIVLINEVSHFISSHYLTIDEVLNAANTLLATMIKELDEYKLELEKNGDLDPNAFKKIKKVFEDEIENSPITLIGLKQIKLVNESISSFSVKLPRTTFLRNNNIDTDFWNIGSILTKYIMNELNSILRKRGCSQAKNFPSVSSGIKAVVITRGIQQYLVDNGFSFTDREIIWPDNTTAYCLKLNYGAIDSFYCISDKDTLFKCQIGESNPFKLDIVDMGEDIEVNIHFFFKANL